MFNMESRHLLNLSVQNALDCILENFKLKKKIPEEHAPKTPKKSALFAVLMAAITPILPLYTISLGHLYHKILRPPPIIHSK